MAEKQKIQIDSSMKSDIISELFFSEDNNKKLETKPKFEKQKKYNFISQNQRERFLSLILSQKYSLRLAAKKCGLIHSTAKAIFKLYKREGRIGKYLKIGQSPQTVLILNEQQHTLVESKTANLKNLKQEKVLRTAKRASFRSIKYNNNQYQYQTNYIQHVNQNLIPQNLNQNTENFPINHKDWQYLSIKPTQDKFSSNFNNPSYQSILESVQQNIQQFMAYNQKNFCQNNLFQNFQNLELAQDQNVKFFMNNNNPQNFYQKQNDNNSLISNVNSLIYGLIQYLNIQQNRFQNFSL